MALTNNTAVWKIMAGILVTLLIIFYLFYYFSSLFIVFIFGIILIMLAEKSMKIYNKIFYKFNLPKFTKSVLGYFMVFLLVIGLIYFIGISVNEILSRFNQSGSISPFDDFYENNLKPNLPSFIEKYVFNKGTIDKVETNLLASVSRGISSIGTFIFKSLLIIPLMFLIYFKRRNIFIESIANLVPKKFHKSTISAVKEISSQLKDFFNAKVIESSIIAFICCTGFYFLGLEGWFFLGLLAGFLNIVPFLGPFLGAILPILVALTYSLNTVYWVLGVIIFAQLVDNFYLIPFMISDKVKMDSLLSIVLILVASQLFGAFGMIFIIPMYLIGKIIMAVSYEELVKIYE